jgi:hypothetical protein
LPQKRADHHPQTYDNASMPYLERLASDGVSLHTGFNMIITSEPIATRGGTSRAVNGG